MSSISPVGSFSPVAPNTEFMPIEEQERIRGIFTDYLDRECRGDVSVGQDIFGFMENDF